jgi:general secretion pathway protein C
MLPLRIPVVSDRAGPASAALLVWALAAGSVMFWWLHSPRQDLALSSPVGGTPATSDAQTRAAVARALGQTSARAATPDAQRRFQLLGVIAAESGHGSALLAVDGQPAQAFVQGQSVGEDWQLQSVNASGVRLSALQGGGTLDLGLPVKP